MNYASVASHLGGDVDSKCIKHLAIELSMLQRVAPWSRKQWDAHFFSTESMNKGIDVKPLDRSTFKTFLFCHQFATESEAAQYCSHLGKDGNLITLMKGNLLDEKFHPKLENLTGLVSVDQIFHHGGRAFVTCKVKKVDVATAEACVDEIIALMR